MLQGIRKRINKRRQGISYAHLLMYGFVWIVRTVTLGSVRIDYRYILAQPVPDRSILRGRAAQRVNVVTLTGQALTQASASDNNGAFGREPRDAARFQRRVERGDVCFAAMRGDRAEGVLWLSWGIYDEPDVKANFDVGHDRKMAWDSNLYIVDDARGGFVFAGLWDAANAYMRTHGIAWAATQTSAFNGASLQAHRRMQTRKLARILYLCFGPVQLTLTSLRPHMSLLWPSQPGPVYQIFPPAHSN